MYNKIAHTASQSGIDAGVLHASDVNAAWKLGEQVAKQIIEPAKKMVRLPCKKLNKYRPKKWTGSFAMGSTAGQLKPIMFKAANQFRPLPPPDFTTEMKELKDFKPDFRSNSLAYKWDK